MNEESILYSGKLTDLLVAEIKERYCVESFQIDKINTLNFLPLQEKKRRLELLNNELYEKLEGLELMNSDIFDSTTKALDEDHFFFCELGFLVDFNIRDSLDFDYYATGIDLYDTENVNCEKNAFYKLIKTTTERYELAKNYEWLLNHMSIQEQTSIRDLDKDVEKLWLVNAKITFADFIKTGVEGGLWDENLNLLLKRGSVYGSGKMFLGSLSIVLKSVAISENIDYKVVGEAFCKTFQINIDESIEDPFKSFQVGDSKYIKEIRRFFRVS